MKKTLKILVAAAAVAGNASADTMYKCTDPSGKVSYSDQPCSGKNKAATLNVVAPQRPTAGADEDDQGVSLQARKPRETESERLKRAEADFQERRRKREEAEAAEEERAAMIRRGNILDRYKPQPKPVDPKQTTLSAPTRQELERAAQQRQQDEKRRRDALLPSSQ